MQKTVIVGNRLQAYRQAKKLSVAELAAMVGSTPRTILAIEHEDKCFKEYFVPTVRLALLLALALDCKVTDLFFLTFKEGE